MPEASPPSSPGVRFPPPLLFAAGLGAGALAQRTWRLPLPGGRVVALPLAYLLAAAGLGLIAWGVLTFHRARTGIVPNRPATTIVAHGPYRFTRNPMYVGMTTLYLGVTLWMDSAWPLLLLPLVLLALQRWVIRREERYLTLAFGAEYEAYRHRVPRWLGRVR